MASRDLGLGVGGVTWDGRSWIGPDRRGEHKSAGSAGEAETGPGEAPLTGGVRTAAGGERAPPGGEGAVEAGRGGERAAAAGEGASAGGARTIATAATAATEHAPPAEPRPLDVCSHAHHVILCPLVVLIGWREGQEAGLANGGGFGGREAEVRERAPPAGEGETAVLQVWVGKTSDWERAPASGEREAAASQRWTTDGAALVKHHRYGRVEKDCYHSYLFISMGKHYNICVLCTLNKAKNLLFLSDIWKSKKSSYDCEKFIDKMGRDECGLTFEHMQQ